MRHMFRTFTTNDTLRGEVIFIVLRVQGQPVRHISTDVAFCQDEYFGTIQKKQADLYKTNTR